MQELLITVLVRAADRCAIRDGWKNWWGLGLLLTVALDRLRGLRTSRPVCGATARAREIVIAESGPWAWIQTGGRQLRK